MTLITRNKASVNGSCKSAGHSLNEHGTVCGRHRMDVYAVWENVKPSGDGNGTLVQIKARYKLQSCQPSLVNSVAELKCKILH
jgi:hypothetical protein